MIKTGILGTSETADYYAKLLTGLNGFELTGCFSPDYSKAKVFAAQYNLIAYPSAEALFNYADVLIITDFFPDFLLNTEKAIKNFKHILITNPFLAGFEEIQHLRKLSEESGVLMQIAGGFRYPEVISYFESRNCYLADLKHSFGINHNSCYVSRFAELVLHDVSLLLKLLKGSAKKASINSWERDDKENGLVSVRLELDNGCVANLLINKHEKVDSLDLFVYGNTGETKFRYDPEREKGGEATEGAIKQELLHLEMSIRNSQLSTCHNDIMFQALELVHRIKSKTFQNFAVNFPN